MNNLIVILLIAGALGALDHGKLAWITVFIYALLSLLGVRF